jgi:hypothetical protein
MLDENYGLETFLVLASIYLIVLGIEVPNSNGAFLILISNFVAFLAIILFAINLIRRIL